MTAPLSTQDVSAGLEAHGVPVGQDEAERLAGYLNELDRWNRVHNLTGIRERGRLIERHLVESLALSPYVRGRAAADVGSGAGIPGLPLAICLPAVAFTLIESRRKRASFLRHVATSLGLDNVAIAHARAEDVDTGPFSTVLARAVAPPAALWEIMRRLVAPGGRILVLAGEDKGREFVSVAEGFTELSTADATPGIGGRIVVLEHVP